MDTIGYIILAVTIIALVMLVIYLDRRRNRWLDISRGLAEDLAKVSNAEKFYATLYSVACQANETMATGLQEQRLRIAELESLVNNTPSVSPDDAVSAMKYCGTCHTFMHPNHFVVLPQHVISSTP
jgi:hypothetical protein